MDRYKGKLAILIIVIFVLMQLTSVLAQNDDMNGSEFKDKVAPSTPENLQFIKISKQEVSFKWDPSTDNGDNVGYIIYVNSQKTAVTMDTEYTHVLGDLTKAAYQVSAIDFSGNESEPSFFLILSEEMTRNAADESVSSSDEVLLSSVQPSTTSITASGYPIKIDSTENHNLLLTEQGQVWAWGSNEYGELGDGSVVSRSTPKVIELLTNIVDISAGTNHSLALDNDGNVWAWGLNDKGQLGNGTLVDQKSPVKLTNLTDVIQISANGNHSLALKSNGTVWAFGENAYGQLGNGTTSDSNNPVQVTGLTDIVYIETGFSSSYAISNVGTPYSWGGNLEGQLGDGTLNQRTTPAYIPSLTDIEEIHAGRSHVVAVKANGTVWSFGDNFCGQLGDGTNIDRQVPVQIESLSLVRTVQVGTNCSFSINSQGQLYSWGENTYGQLGNGSFTDSNIPGVISNINNVNLVAAGLKHTIATTENGNVLGWGVNDKGQLADGGAVSNNTASQITSIQNGSYPEAGNQFSFIGVENTVFENYAHKITLSIDHQLIEENLQNFPVTAYLDSTNFAFEDSNMFGYDVVFTDKYMNVLPFEREIHDKENEVGIYHIKLPEIKSDIDTQFFMFYGYEEPIDYSSSIDVWDENYIFVSHLGESLYDSTVNNRDMQNSGTSYIYDGTGGYRDFSGIGQYISIDVDFDIIKTAMTAEVMFKADQVNSQKIILFQGEAGSSGYNDGNGWQLALDNGALISTSIYDESLAYDCTNSQYFFDTADIHYVSTSIENYDGVSFPNINQIIDGTLMLDTASTEISTIENITDTIYLGAPSNGSDNIFDGQIYDLRISDCLRSEAWIKATYESYKDNLLSFTVIKEDISYDNSTLYLDCYEADNYSANYQISNYSQPYQSIQSPNQQSYITDVAFYLKRYGSLNAAELQVFLYESTGTVGIDAVPTGECIAETNIINCHDLGTDYSLIEFEFPNKVYLEPNTGYSFVIKPSGYMAYYEYVHLGIDTSSPTHPGNGRRWVSSQDCDYVFFLTGESFGPKILGEDTKNFKTIRGSSIITDGNSSITLTNGVDFQLDNTKGEDTWFCYLTNSMHTGMGEISGGGSQNGENFTVNITYSGDDIIFSREGNVGNCRVDWEILQYVGKGGGPNEIVVRKRNTLTLANSVLSLTDTVLGVSSESDCVPWICAQSNSDIDRLHMASGLFTANLLNGEVTFQRGDSYGEAKVSYALIEFTGENWQVQNNIFTVADGTSNLTESIELNRSFYHSQYRTTDNPCGLDDASVQVILSETLLTADCTTTVNGENKILNIYTISNTSADSDMSINVQWVSNALMEEALEEEVENTTINPVLSLENTSIMSYTNDSTGTGTAFPRGSINHYLSDTNNVMSRQSDNGQTQYMTFAIVEWPLIKDVINTDNYDLKYEVTINAECIDTNLENFPVRILLNNENFDFTKIKSEGRDIVFTNIANQILDYECVKFSTEESFGEFYVNIPIIDSLSDTVFYIYVGQKGQLYDLSNPNGVWDDNFSSVIHLGEEIYDSIGNSNITINGTTFEISDIGETRHFDGINDYLIINSPDIFNYTEGTVSVYLKPDSMESVDVIFVSGVYGSNGTQDDKSQFFGRIGSNATIKAGWCQSAINNIEAVYCNNAVNTSSYSHFAIAWHYDPYLTSSMIGYVDGNFSDTDRSIHPPVAAWKDYLTIGKAVDAYNSYYHGEIDEIRVSNTKRTAEWIKAESDNIRQNDFLTIVRDETFGSEIKNFKCYSFGSNGDGQLGVGSDLTSYIPMLVQNLDNIKMTSCGYNHTLFLDNDGIVWGTGSNDRSQLGTSLVTNISNEPVQAQGLGDIVWISAGNGFSGAVNSSGAVFMWGSNNRGQLCNGTTSEITTPTEINGITNITQLSFGYEHVLMLKGDGTVWSCGANEYGQLGDGTTIDKTTITQVTGLTNIIAIEAGGYHSMALCSDGSYYVWGSNAYGQLGDGTTANKTSPLQLTSISDVEQMSAGGHHTLIRNYNGRVYAFGLNNVGQLGDGTYDNRTTPVLLNEPISAKDISAGFNHSLIAAGGTIYASGSNEYMQLGIERLLGSNVPIVSCIQFSEVKTETEEFSISVVVDDMVSFTGKTFTVTYDPNILILLDACGFTWDKEIASSTQILQGTDVRILSISEGTIVFEVVKTVPANTTWSGSVNIIHFRKLHTGDPNLSLVMN